MIVLIICLPSQLQIRSLSWVHDPEIMQDQIRFQQLSSIGYPFAVHTNSPADPLLAHRHSTEAHHRKSAWERTEGSLGTSLRYRKRSFPWPRIPVPQAPFPNRDTSTSTHRYVEGAAASHPDHCSLLHPSSVTPSPLHISLDLQCWIETACPCGIPLPCRQSSIRIGSPRIVKHSTPLTVQIDTISCHTPTANTVRRRRTSRVSLQ